jgi:hypothetical protein
MQERHALKPNFLVIGAAKAATTSLCQLLGLHPQVFMSRPKEPFFFCYDHVYAQGWPWYERLFEGADGKRAIGEGSTPYSQTGTYPNTVERIVKHLPDARILYITRHPLDRLESMWIELLSQGLTMLPFNRALREDPQYIDSALYWKQLSAYRKYFPDERVKLLFFDDFQRDPDAVLRSCFEFLGVDASIKIENADEPRYASEGKRKDRGLTNFLRTRLPFFLRLRDISPSWLRSFARASLKTPIPGRPRWDQDTRTWVIESIRDDVATFLRHAGKPEDYWKLEV